MTDDAREPHMHVIVRQARILSGVLDGLDRAPRRILRRTHRSIPVGRVQELDRRSMIWSARQPGETLAERAGDRQRLLAVAREESYDTLENRVLRAYAELAGSHARDYAARHRGRSKTTRLNRVEGFGRRCRRLARDLAEKGVPLADPDVTPNYVLIENPRYHQVWDAWRELLALNPVEDELWRWQARSWEEFSALALVVALVSMEGARIIAASPLVFRAEQRRGSWIDHDNPLVVVHLPLWDAVVEVQYALSDPAEWRAGFAAPIWIRFGRVDQYAGFLNLVAIWPLWDQIPGLLPGELGEIAEVPKRFRQNRLVRCLVLRPGDEESAGATDTSGGAAAIALDAAGLGLRLGLIALREFIQETIRQGTD